MVYFVGAGTGAADLITVRGAKLLSQADVIIYAGSLVNPQLLEYAKADCAIHNSAKMTLDDVLDVMKQADWIIDVGPDGGTSGGQVVFTGTPRKMAEQANTITAEYLRKSL